MYFKYDAADLSANRNGVLSPKQKVRFKSEKKIIIANVRGRANFVEAKSFNADNGREIIHHELQIGSKRFMATTILADIMQGNEYILYYIDHSSDQPDDASYFHSSDDVLSVELLSNAANVPFPEAASLNDSVDL
jgi:hypothetical protein